MYEASWEWLESRIGKDVMPVARAYVEYNVDQRQPVGREGPRDVPREKDREQVLNFLCQSFDTDFDEDEDQDDAPEKRVFHFFMKVYDHLASATDTFKALCLLQKGVWSTIPDNIMQRMQRGDENDWTDPWCWERMKRFNLLEPDASVIGGYRIPYPQLVDCGILMARFAWDVDIPEHLLPERVKKKRREKKRDTSSLTLNILSETPEKHCYKFDEGCLFCRQGKEGLLHQLTGDLQEVFPCRYSGQVDGEKIEKEGFVCREHLDAARKDSSLNVVEK